MFLQATLEIGTRDAGVRPHFVRVERGERPQPRRVVARAQVEQAVGVRQLAGEAERRLRCAGAAQRLAVRVVRARFEDGVRAAGHAAHAAQAIGQRPLLLAPRGSLNSMTLASQLTAAVIICYLIFEPNGEVKASSRSSCVVLLFTSTNQWCGIESMKN